MRLVVAPKQPCVVADTAVGSHLPRRLFLFLALVLVLVLALVLVLCCAKETIRVCACGYVAASDLVTTAASTLGVPVERM